MGSKGHMGNLITSACGHNIYVYTYVIKQHIKIPGDISRDFKEKNKVI